MSFKKNTATYLDLLETIDLKLQENMSQNIELPEVNLGYTETVGSAESGFDFSIDLPSSLCDQWGLFYKSVSSDLNFTVMHKVDLYDLPLVLNTEPNWSICKSNELTGSLGLGETISFLGDQGQGLVLSRSDKALTIEPLIDIKVPTQGITKRSIEIGRTIAQSKNTAEPQLDLNQLFEEMDSWGGFTIVIEKTAFRALDACNEILQMIDSPEDLEQEIMFYELESNQQFQYLNRLWTHREKLEALHNALALLGEEESLSLALKKLDQRAETALTILHHLIDLTHLPSDHQLPEFWLESHPEAWWTVLAV